jgi:hypothetical protein
VKVFGCRPVTDGATISAACGRRSKTSKGGNRGKDTEGCGALYGDLAAARGAADESRWGRAERSMRTTGAIGLFR